LLRACVVQLQPTSFGPWCSAAPHGAHLNDRYPSTHPPTDLSAVHADLVSRCDFSSASLLHAIQPLSAGGATIWERITRHKAPVIEPRDSGAFAAALADYAAKLEDPNGSGAVLFAVCRGKVRAQGSSCHFSAAAGSHVVVVLACVGGVRGTYSILGWGNLEGTCL
jgi:hypothetical protein